MKNLIIRVTALAAVVLFALPVSAEVNQAQINQAVRSIQKNWAQANYATEGRDRKKAFKSLVVEADKAASAEPDNADVHIWVGIVYSTNAGEVSMFSAGKQVKRARAELDRALEIDPDAMSGAAYTSLGALLFQIPGFMGGDDELAENMLKKGVEMNADGIDANFFYGKFLLEQDRLDESEIYLTKALQAPDRPERPLADSGRRAEVNEALAKLKKERS